MENTYIHQEYGAYVMATVAKVKIGANIWEVMPENRDKFFFDKLGIKFDGVKNKYFASEIKKTAINILFFVFLKY